MSTILPTFTLHGVTTFNVNNIESPFIVHWLEFQGDRASEGHSPNWTNVVNLYQSALDVAKIWSAHSPADRDRLLRKVDVARNRRAAA